MIDKRVRAHLFRDRLTSTMERTQTSQSALAQKIRADRSTISQLLKRDGARLPNAHLVGACAQALGVSADWLLGLTEHAEPAADLLAASLTLTSASRTVADEQIFEWHREAEGYKIRHVPAMLPDMLKSPAMLEWEYTPHLGRSTKQAIAASQDRLNWMRQSTSGFEIAVPLFEVDSLARGTGYYATLDRDLRRDQLDVLIELTETLYPRLRLYLFDARHLYSAPVTVFGPMLAVLYLGTNYLAFRDTERVRALTTHFDTLVKAASVSSRDLPAHLEALKREI